jgi:hypothetical protein
MQGPAREPQHEAPPAAPLEPASGPDGLDALPGLAHVAAGAAWHTGGWALRQGLALSRRLALAAVSPAAAIDLARDARNRAERLLVELERGVTGNGGDPASRRSNTPGGASRPAQGGGAPANGQGSDQLLRAEGEELLRRSRDVNYEFDAHPAYERILSELAPDEARILRLLLLSGPQPSVDVRTGGPLGLVRSRLVAPGVSMIGARAGCRYVERVPSYLNNLFRLGLVWFSRETLRDHQRYQVLEAQPEVLDAIHSVPYAKIVRRSIHLTPFGEDFCRVCLCPEEAVGHELPEHSAPPEDKVAGQPPPELP